MGIIICVIVILALNASAYSQDYLDCGIEVRLDLQNGITLTGKLAANNSQSLSIKYARNRFHEVSLTDVKAVYQVHRKKGTGILIGSVIGAGAGFAIGMGINRNRRSKGGWGPSGIDNAIWKMGSTISGAVVGGIAGGLIGNSIYSYRKIKLGALPLCISPYRNVSPLKIKVSMNF